MKLITTYTNLISWRRWTWLTFHLYSTRLTQHNWHLGPLIDFSSWGFKILHSACLTPPMCDQHNPDSLNSQHYNKTLKCLHFSISYNDSLLHMVKPPYRLKTPPKSAVCSSSQVALHCRYHLCRLQYPNHRPLLRHWNTWTNLHRSLGCRDL
jgi:hypothetical protein